MPRLFERIWRVTALEPGRQLRWSYLPPLMIYFAAGISGLTAIVSTFFVKEQFGFSAAFLAGIAFWAGIPWTLKMPLGHLVDLIWRWKGWLVCFGALLLAAHVGIMYGLITQPEAMARIIAPEAWYVMSILLAPTGYVIQDTVADAMTVEAVPTHDREGQPLSDDALKSLHTTMQTLGRLAIIFGFTAVAALNIWMFSGIDVLTAEAKIEIYADIYLLAFFIPALSVLGVALAFMMHRVRTARSVRGQSPHLEVTADKEGSQHRRGTLWAVLLGGAAFAIFTLAIGFSGLAYGQEIVFVGSLTIITFLISRLLVEVPAAARRALIGTAVIIFIFRTVPSPGPGVTWWEIDVLGFDQQFLSVLSLLTSSLTLLGMLVLRPFMATRSVADVVLILTIAGTILSLPNIGLFYGIHEWTSRHTGGFVDARFIAILDTALESPLGQIAMIPMLAWIARNAPDHLKATFFAVMASFTNLALSASSLATKYLNLIFLVEREVRDLDAGTVLIAADYSELGGLLIVVTIIALALPIAAIALIQMSRWRTTQ